MDKVLVVDDEPDTANLAKMILEDAGYRVTCASGGDEALKTVETSAPDLILLDLVMPGKSGLQVCKILRDQSWTRRTPVIMFTVLGRPVDKKLTSDAGANAHLTKPFTKETLLSEVAKFISAAKAGKFSNQLGMDHKQLLGRKILVEFDPRTDYERVVRDFTLECVSHGEKTIILSREGSVIRQVLQSEMNIEFMELDPTIKFSSLLSDNEGRSLSLVLDNLTDLSLSRSEEVAYKFTQNSLLVLAEQRVTAIFLVNPLAHNEKSIASLRGLFSNQLTYENHCLKFVRSAA